MLTGAINIHVYELKGHSYDCQKDSYSFKSNWSQHLLAGLQATRGSDRSLRPFMFCTAVSTSLSGEWGQQLLPKCICAKACQPALPAHSKGQSVSGGAPVGGCKVRLVGGWPGWSFLTQEPASQQDQTGCRVNHHPSYHLTKSEPGQYAATCCLYN